MKFPTEQQVQQAITAGHRLDLLRWQRFLPGAENDHEVRIINTVVDGLRSLGGITPGLSKTVGWDKP